MIAIVDYGVGNIRNVERAFRKLDMDVVVTRDTDVIDKSEVIILPGVGAYRDAMMNLQKYNLIDCLKRNVESGKLIFGICLGMQLLLEESQEAPGIKGLAVVKGKVVKFKGNLIVPHMGWNQIKIKNGNIFRGVKDGSYFYFAHSYYCKPSEPVISATTKYGVEFASALNKDKVWAVQFHPEKSQELGLKVLRNFLEI